MLVFTRCASDASMDHLKAVIYTGPLEGKVAAFRNN
jgi:hypothetical protein